MAPYVLTLLSALGVCAVGCIPIASTTTPLSSLLSIVFACPPVLLVSISPVYISAPASAATILLLSLSPFLIQVMTTVTTILLPIEFYSLMSHSAVIYIEDVLFSHLSAQGCVRERTVSESIHFWVKLVADFSAICSLWSCVAIYVFWTEEVLKPLHHPQTWVYVRVYLLIPLTQLPQTTSTQDASS